MLEVTYKNKKLQRQCTEYKCAVRIYGITMAEKIFMRINEICASDSVDIMIRYNIGRCHSLQGNRKGEFAVDLVHPFRLVFENKDEFLQIVRIISIEDYH